MSSNGKIFWLIVTVILLGGVTLASYVQYSTTQIQQALAEEVLQQQHDVANLLHEYAGVMLALERLRLRHSADNRTQIVNSISRAHIQLRDMRSNYSFQRLDGAAKAHAFVRPVLEDVDQWISSGIPGHDKEQPIILDLAAKRLDERYPTLRKIAAETDDVATRLISAQSGHLERFRSSLLWLFSGFSLLTLGISILLIKQRNLQASLAHTQRQHAQRFKDFADAGADLFWESDAALNLRILSGGAESRPRSFALRSSVRDSLYPDMATEFNEHRARKPWPVDLMESHDSFYDVEVEWITTDGTSHQISFSGKPVLNAKSEFLGYRGVGRNITDRKRMEQELQQTNALLVQAESRGREQAEQALKESEQFHRTILDALPLDIVILDTKGTIKAVNESWRQFLNTAELDIPEGGIGMNYRDVYATFSRRPQQGLQRTIEHIDAMLEKGSTSFSDEFACSVSKKELWIALSTTSFDAAEDRFTVLVHEDVTERMHLQERDRRLRAELAHVSRLNIAGELASGLAHELNQPLTSISHDCDTLLSIINESDLTHHDMSDVVTDIYHQSHRAGDIIRSMRRLIRKEAAVEKPVDINKLVRETVGLTQADARALGITIDLQLADDLPSPSVDAVQLQQVLINLERNSVEAMSDSNSGTKVLTIATRLRDKDAIQVTVQDTGPGFDTSIKGRLFSTFVTTKEGGMGLGLSISRTIIEAQGGVLWLDESCETQTTVRFTIPIARD